MHKCGGFLMRVRRDWLLPAHLSAALTLLALCFLRNAHAGRVGSCCSFVPSRSRGGPPEIDPRFGTQDQRLE